MQPLFASEADFVAQRATGTSVVCCTSVFVSTLINEVGFSARGALFLANQVAESSSIVGLVQMRLTPPFCDRSDLSLKGEVWLIFEPYVVQIFL